MTATSPTFRRHATVVVGAFAAVALALGPAEAGLAAPKPTESELRADLAELGKKADTLGRAYRAKRESLKKAQKAEAAAKESLRKAEEAYAEARNQVVSAALVRYQSSAGTLPSVLLTLGLSGAAVTEQLTVLEVAQLRGFAAGLHGSKQAVEKATRLADEIEAEVEELGSRRAETREAIGDLKGRLDRLVPTGSGRRADGTWAPQQPTGTDNITDRTRTMRDTIKKRFDLPYEVGCYRSGNDGGEHPLGRACDFMMSSGGAMPTAANLKLGDEIAAWTLENRDKLGVKYVIWRQRINHGSGWRAMEDRGSITQNHYDHVHISMH
ncbi:hypothetical protein GCM10010517_70010 [Streptosporangium fragile]|uniref:ARB-07466-like C-terminal domain-containing protein n=1 Tax=Streptosporangium fragile TaxID=46186 RepID=A0ABN3W8L5_9ACTN